MNNSIKTVAAPLSLLLFVLFLAHPAAGQVKKRIILVPEWSPSVEEEEEAWLELQEIRVAGRLIAPGQTFDADENWLKGMTLRVKVVGSKPFAAFSLGGQLFETVDGKSLPHESVKYSVMWMWGRAIRPQQGKPKLTTLKPGVVVELNYKNVEEIYREALVEAQEGTFCKLDMWGFHIQYHDGTVLDARLKYTGNTGHQPAGCASQQRHVPDPRHDGSQVNRSRWAAGEAGR
jgi:hypothetical protein